MYILAIETSCDDTSAAVSQNNTILSNIVSSQLDEHNKWGGIVPAIARRNHILKIDTVIEQALKDANVQPSEINAIAVTQGPGLSIALEIGIQKAKELAQKFDKPLIAVNHMAGHIYANFESRSELAKDSDPFALLALLMSGKHTEIIEMTSHLEFNKIGKTLDDSIGESFDKVSKLLGGGYPGGAYIEKLAVKGDENAFKFPVPMKDQPNFNFSYSGLKTAVLQTIKNNSIEVTSSNTSEAQAYQNEGIRLTLSKKPTYQIEQSTKANIAACFQKAATAHILDKLKKAIVQKPTHTLLLGGGVVNNSYIIQKIKNLCEECSVKLHYPQDKLLLTDNAGMVAVAAYYMAQRNQYVQNLDTLDRIPRLSL